MIATCTKVFSQKHESWIFKIPYNLYNGSFQKNVKCPTVVKARKLTFFVFFKCFSRRLFRAILIFFCFNPFFYPVFLMVDKNTCSSYNFLMSPRWKIKYLETRGSGQQMHSIVHLALFYKKIILIILKYVNIHTLNIRCPGKEVKRYPSGVRFDNQKVFSCTRSWDQIFWTFFWLLNKQ